jgi:hypothetical protein
MAALLALMIWSALPGQSTQASNWALLPSQLSSNSASIPSRNAGTTPVKRVRSVINIAASNATQNEKAKANILCTGKNDNATINKAISSNTNVVLSSGTFRVTSNIYICSKTNVTIAGSSGTKIYRDAAAQAPIVEIDSSDNVIIQGIEMFSAADLSNPLVEVSASTSVQISNNYFHDFKTGVWMESDRSSHVKSSHIQVINNEFSNYHYCSIGVGNGVEYADINDNVIHDGSAGKDDLLYGIATQTIGESDKTSPLCEYVNIERNQIYNQNAHNAIDVHGGNHILVSENKISNIAKGGIYSHFCPATGFRGITSNIDWTISGNSITNVSYGIAVDSQSPQGSLNGIVIDSNVVDNWSDQAIYVSKSTSGCKIENVQISNNSLAYVKIYPSQVGFSWILSSRLIDSL